MKKFLLVFLISLGAVSCSLDDGGGQKVYYEIAGITDHDLPEELVFGQQYKIEITYNLPSACHSLAGLDVTREGSETSEKRRNITVAVITATTVSGECEGDVDADLERTTSFNIIIDEEEEFTFNFQTGVTSSGDPIYETVVVPVIKPEIQQ